MSKAWGEEERKEGNKKMKRKYTLQSWTYVLCDHEAETIPCMRVSLPSEQGPGGRFSPSSRCLPVAPGQIKKPSILSLSLTDVRSPMRLACPRGARLLTSSQGVPKGVTAAGQPHAEARWKRKEKGHRGDLCSSLLRRNSRTDSLTDPQSLRLH